MPQLLNSQANVCPPGRKKTSRAGGFFVVCKKGSLSFSVANISFFVFLYHLFQLVIYRAKSPASMGPLALLFAVGKRQNVIN